MADVLGTIQIQALPIANKPDGTELLPIKQGTADKRTTIAEAIAVHGDLTNNPHNVDKYQVGLGNVTNDAQLKLASNLGDLSDKAAARLNLLVYSRTETDAKYVPLTRKINNKVLSTDITLVASDVGLGNVPNYTASTDYKEDADKFSTARAVSALYRAIQNETPVGSVLHTFDSRNPGTYKLCGGTWQLIGKGQTLVGYDDTNPSRAIGSTFGAKTATLVTANLPKHSHAVNITSGSHSHGVVGNTAGAGAHNHNVTGSTSVHNYGSPSAVTSGGGGHNHSGNTSTNGSHVHDFPLSNDKSGTGRADGANANRFDGNQTVNPAGDHSHSFTTSWNGDHQHSVTIDIGAHSHTVSGSTTPQGDHVHSINFASQSSSVNIVGNTEISGSDTPFSIEQPSLICYIWRRMS